MLEIKLPEVGENIKSGTVVNVMVKVGDKIKKGQDILELETDKASLPVPSPVDGIVQEILVKAGQQVLIGAVVLKVDATGPAAKPAAPAPSAKPAVSAPPAAQEIPQTQAPVLASTGPIKVAVIGGGPGGYAAAFLAADLGLQVTLIDKEQNPGGVCLFRGCIPSKALLHAAKILAESKEAKHFGIEFDKPRINLDKLREWKNDVVKKLTSGLGQLCKQRKVTFVQGVAEFLNSNTVLVRKSDGSTQEVAFDKAVLATGSRPRALPIAPKSPRILDSTSALDLENIPQSLLLVGGGYIGLELGTVYAELGTEVSVVEVLPQLMTGADRDIAGVLEKKLKTLLKEMMVNTKLSAMKEADGGVTVSFEDQTGKKFDKTYEKVLVAIGRQPNTENLGLEKTRVTLTEKGFIKVNAQLQTTDPNIFAIGDLTGNPMLAHKASHEGRVAVEVIAGHKVVFEPKAIPAVVFTDPEIAWAGLTELEAQQQGREVTVVKFPWGASGRALTLDRTDGLTKLIIDPATERLLGVSIVGPHAGDLIAEGVLAIEMGAVVADLKLSIHPHPTLSETLMEAAEVFFGQSTHVYKPKK